MNIPVIFAGGSGTRMNTKSRPKQFLELNGKPMDSIQLPLAEIRRGGTLKIGLGPEPDTALTR